MTHGATLKVPLQSLRGNSLALLHFSQLGAEYSGSIETLLTQSDTSIKGRVKRVCPHYNTFCKCVPCDFPHTGSLFKLTTDSYHFL